MQWRLVLARLLSSVRPQLKKAVDWSCHLPPRTLQPSAKMSSDEVAKAAAAAVEDAGKPTIFAKILSKEIPADIIHEDDKVNGYALRVSS